LCRYTALTNLADAVANEEKKRLPTVALAAVMRALRWGAVQAESS
jgi:hypothetical protein